MFLFRPLVTSFTSLFQPERVGRNASAVAKFVRRLMAGHEEAIERGWAALDPLAQLRDPLASLFHPYGIGQAEDLDSRLRAAQFLRQMLPDVRRFAVPYIMRQWAVSGASRDGLFLEFGVGSAISTNQIARVLGKLNPKARLFGFDSFAGLPEDWRPGVKSGEYAQNSLPPVEPNVTLVVGLFQETLDRFLLEDDRPVAFAHIDSDLYSSCEFVLRTLIEKRRLCPGSVILFDELFNYPGWFSGGEYLSLSELLPNDLLDYRFIAIAPLFQQAAIRVVPTSVHNPHHSAV